MRNHTIRHFSHEEVQRKRQNLQIFARKLNFLCENLKIYTYRYDKMIKITKNKADEARKINFLGPTVYVK